MLPATLQFLIVMKVVCRSRLGGIDRVLPYTAPAPPPRGVRRSGVNHTQAEHGLERVKVAIIVQQFVSLAQTQRGDQAVDGLPDRVAPRPQAALVAR